MLDEPATCSGRRGTQLSPGATSLDLGAVKSPRRRTRRPSTLPIEQPLDVTLEDALHLVGSSAPGAAASWRGPGGQPVLAGAARIAAAAQGFFAVVQLLDDNGQVAAGWEGPRRLAPHQRLASGRVGAQSTGDPPAATLADGRYRLVAGVFDPVSGQRLPASGARGLVAWSNTARHRAAGHG